MDSSLNSMYKLCFLLLCIGAATSSPSTPVGKCIGVKQEMFKRVVVSTPKGVCTQLPCELIGGANVTADITFLVRSEVQKITLKCNATSFGVTFDYPVPHADKGCDMLTNTYCPVEANTEADLRFITYVSKAFPKVPANLVFYLLNERKQMISCFHVSVLVESGKALLTDTMTSH